MKTKLAAASIAAIALAFAPRAHAQTAEQGGRMLAAPARALEVVVGTGYTQGFGMLQPGVDMRNVVNAGVGVDLGVLYRINPRWAVGLVGQYNELDAERATAARGFTTGFAAMFHAAPYRRLDPWVQLSTGYRGLWEIHNDGTPTIATHSLELAKLSVGVDLRASRDVAIGPVIGADLTLPLWQSNGGGAANAISDPRVATFVFAGVQARFDVGGERVRPEQTGNENVVVTQARIRPQPVRPVSPSINVSEQLLAACNMDLADVGKAPKFDFDKSDLLPADRAVLKKIAECFTTGPLKGKGLLLVGRADPRGTIAYNDRLGMRRANSVADFLEENGIEDRRIEHTSRGKRDATGTDEATWAIDRRVDVLQNE
ncbi:MAG TPA: OmpA family protein [Polyangiaceae bacterium]